MTLLEVLQYEKETPGGCTWEKHWKDKKALAKIERKRLQVEHAVTEMVTGIDIVKEQIRIARGEPLSFTQDHIQPTGTSIECRIYAEDPDTGFMPSPGRVHGLRVPQGPGVRDDSGLYEGGEVPIYYDPMISKLITWGDDRAHAIARMRRALAEYEVRGVPDSPVLFFAVASEDDARNRSPRSNTARSDR